MEEINLDFLQSLPSQNHYDEGKYTPDLFNDIDSNCPKKKYGSKIFKMAQNIAKVDKLVQEIDKLKSINNDLQQQLRGFQVSAQQVQDLYTKEKEEHIIAKCNLEQLQKDYHKIDVDLTNISMLNGQLKARLADYDRRPVSYDNLAVKYLKIMNKLEGHDILKYNLNKDLIEKLKEYCKSRKLKIRTANSPMKSGSRAIKVKHEVAVQCNLLEERFENKPKVRDQNTQCCTINCDQASHCSNTITLRSPIRENSFKRNDCQTCKTKPKVADKSTQYHKSTRDQGSQYISTMITRHTNTDKIVQKHVQTMFPEPPAIEDILRVYSRWSNIRSVSPILSPTRICENLSKEKERINTGTCTMLCNIRRRIDYLPLNNSSNIKQEYFTPSASPTPTSYPSTTGRSRLNSFSSHQPCNISSSLLNLLNSNTNSSLEHLSSNAFNELWQIFGKMLLSLLQNNNACIANTTQNFPLNQQQFLEWLQELYLITIDQNMPATQTQRDSGVVTSPLLFNEEPTLSGSVLRPQPQKTLTDVDLANIDIKENVLNISSGNISNMKTVFNESQNNSDYINRKAQQVQVINEQQSINSSESKIRKISTPGEQTTSKREILTNIQELLPSTYLNKKERKLLKRLLKNNNHPKKANENRRTKYYDKQSPVVILKNEDYNDDTTETAVDFLKTFAVTQQNNQLLEDISEKEKIFLKQISNGYLPNDASNPPKEFDFIKPCISLTLTHNSPNTSFDISEKSFHEVKNKYQVLFGESDSECEDQEMNTENVILNPQSVIKSSANLGNPSSISSLKEFKKVGSGNTTFDLKEYNNCTIVNQGNSNCSQACTSLKVINPTVCNEQCFDQVNQTENTNSLLKKNITNKPPLSETERPTFADFNNFISTETALIQDMPPPLLKSLEYSGNASDANLQRLYYSSQTGYSSSNNLELSDAKVITVEQDRDTLESLEDCGEDDNPVSNLNVINNMIPQHGIINTSPFVQSDNYMSKESTDCLPSVCGDDSSNDTMNNHDKIITSEPINSDEFENDFVISDNESVITGYESNDADKFNSKTFKDIDICNENFNFNCSNISQNCNFEAADISMKSIKSTQDVKLYSHSVSSDIIELNCLNTTTETDSTKLIELQGEGISIAYPLKESKKTQEEENMNKIVKCESKEETILKICAAEDILKSNFEDTTSKNYAEEMTEIQKSEINHKDISCNIRKANVFMRTFKSPHDSFHQSFQRFVNKSYSERENFVSHGNPLTNFGNKNFIRKKNENTARNVLYSSNTRLRESNFTNQGNNEKNFAPVTMVSDSVSYHKTSETSDNKSDKFSILSSLKLLDINNIHNHQKNSFDSMINTQPVQDIIGTQDNIYENLNLKNENIMNSSYNDEIVKTKASENINSIKTFAYPNTGEESRNERVVILSCSTITKSAHANESENNINSSFCQQYLNTENKVSSEVTKGYSDGIDKVPQNHLNEQDKESSANKIHNLNTACETELSDNSWSIEDKLIIDDGFNTDTSNLTNYNNTISTADFNEIENSYNISSKITPNDEIMIAVNPTVNDLPKCKAGRKRKNDCLVEVQPSKRSQRLKDNQIILEELFNVSRTPIELGKYTNTANNLINNVHLNYPLKEEMINNCSQSKIETIENSKMIENERRLQLGFFRERLIEEAMTTNNAKTFNITKDPEPYASDVKTNSISCRTKDSYKQEEQEKCNKEIFKISFETETANQQAQELENCNSQKDCINTYSPQSPQPSQSNHEESTEGVVTIPLERPLHFMPQANIPTLFDVLISSYKMENNMRFLESVSTKESKRKQNILDKLFHEIKSYCYSTMELDLYCTSKSVIHKLLSISPDYTLIQNALIMVAQNAEGTNTLENDFPSIIQEMPPRHLSKCLQRLFAFLENITTKDNRFCQDLINNIEAILFNSKKSEDISLQTILNLTQLYLMASKIQEQLGVAKHSARLLIAKCLYFYFQNSVLMIHEVLMWYPTVLPHREDKTYDQSDALISVIQHLLMSTKYDMCKPELRGKVLLSKLRYEYHFEPFKPTVNEIIEVLVNKLKCSKFYNIMLGFVLLCKRLGMKKTQDLVLDQHLIPLANEYYCLALKTNEYDKRIAVLLEVISVLIRPLMVSADIQKYFTEFARFLNGFERQIIQEAALCSLLRLQRFNVERCFNLLRHFQPSYNLNTRTQAMLKSFLYRSSLKFWKNLNSQNPKNSY